MLLEIWKDIEDYPNYEVSNVGRVRNKTTKYVLKPQQFVGKKYYYVALSENGIQKKKRIHRLVAEAFIPNPNNLPEINHLDEDPSNNCADNLEWCSKSYNVNYGTRNKRAGEKMIGNTNGISYKVQKYSLDGKFLEEYRSLKQASEMNNIPKGNLSAYFSKGWKQCGGFVWKKV